MNAYTLNARPSVSVKTVLDQDALKRHDAARQGALRQAQAQFRDTVAGSPTDFLLRADSAMKAVRSHLRLGSNAQPDGKLPADEAGMLAQRLRGERDRRYQEGVTQGTLGAQLVWKGGTPYTRMPLESQLRTEADLLKEFGYGHCAEQAAATYFELKAQGVSPVEIGAFTGSEHLLVVVGRRPGSDPHDPGTWGDNTVLVDTWANQAYRLADLPSMQQAHKDIRYLLDDPSRPHYLAGKLCVKPEYVEDEAIVNEV